MAVTLSVLVAASILTVLLPDSLFGLEHRYPGGIFDPHGFKPVQAAVQARMSMLFSCPGLDAGDANITCTNEKLESKHGLGMDCTENLPHNTKAVFLNCPIGYKLAEDYTVLTCKFPGKWDKEMFTCDEVPTEPPTTTTTTKKPKTTTKKVLTTRKTNKTTLATNKKPSNTTTNSTLTPVNSTNPTANNLTTPPTTIANVNITTAVNATNITSANSTSSVVTPLVTLPTLLPNVSTVTTPAIATETTTTSSTSAIGAIPPSVAPGITTMTTPIIPIPTTTTPPTISSTIPTPPTTTTLTTTLPVTTPPTTTPPITTPPTTTPPTTTPPITTPPTDTPTTTTPDTTTPATTPTTNTPPTTTPIPVGYVLEPNIGIIKPATAPLQLSDALNDCWKDKATLLTVDTDFKKAYVKTFSATPVYRAGTDKNDMWVGLQRINNVWQTQGGVNVTSLKPGYVWHPGHPLASGTSCVVYAIGFLDNFDVDTTRCTNPLLKQTYICIRP